MRILCVSASRLFSKYKISSNGVVAIAAFFFYNYCFLLAFSFVHIKVFFSEKVSKSHYLRIKPMYTIDI